MSWMIGKTYDYYGRSIRPVARSFDGALELIAFEFVPPINTAEGKVWVRTAMTLAPCVVPRVSEWLGGVCGVDNCKHWSEYGTTIAKHGPHAGQLCCMGCGGPTEQ